MASNISYDLIWEITRQNSSYLVKRKQAGGVQFSRDPLNLTNKHSKKYEGYANDKAIGILPGENGGVTLLTKKTGSANKPSSALHTTKFGSNKSSRKTYRSIVSSTAKKGYRPDLRAEAVSRASAIRKSQKPVKQDKPAKLRGAKARKANEQ
ncbi:ribosomal protein L28e [Patellaria atrata CBS 101060]|uniref:Ribosomal protein L28e n=1 Tax=Patellaria atrata CBS 101060 TaxID=1346257 RepID=A0A9P4SFX0_9PEZI|nr:ribosomal protein L28e [Patellaria atrata CBS 101060]